MEKPVAPASLEDQHAFNAHAQRASKRHLNAVRLAGNAQRLNLSTARLNDLSAQRGHEAAILKAQQKEMWQENGQCVRCGQCKGWGSYCADCRDDLSH